MRKLVAYVAVYLLLFVPLVLVGSTPDAQPDTRVRIGSAACVVRTPEGVVSCAK